MKTLILNIGLARKGLGNIGTAYTRGALRFSGLRIVQNAVHQSNTEATMVAEIAEHSHWKPLVFGLAVATEQDCIAVYDPATGHGELVGPRAEAWGDFNPEYFVLMDGTRLAQTSIKTAA